MLRDIFLVGVLVLATLPSLAKKTVVSPPYPDGYNSWKKEDQSCLAGSTPIQIEHYYGLQNVRGSDYAEAVYVKRFSFKGRAEPFAVAVRVREIKTPNGRQGITEYTNVYVAGTGGWAHFDTRVDSGESFQKEMKDVEKNIPGIPRGALAECIFRLRPDARVR